MSIRLSFNGLQKWAEKRGFYDFDKFLADVYETCIRMAPYVKTAEKGHILISGEHLYCSFRKPWHEYTVALKIESNGSMITRNIVPDGVRVKEVLNYEGGN